MEVSNSSPETNNNNNSSTQQTPLIENREEELNESLHSLETFLTLFGFCQNSLLSFTLSWVSFLLLGFGLPLLIIIEKSCCSKSSCDEFQIKSFELENLIARSLVAAISLLCVSHNLRKYGVRKFLFVDKCHGHMTQFRQEYIKKIRGFFCLLAVWVLPCLLLKTAREVLRIIYIDKYATFQAVAIITGLLFSWTYSTIIYLSGSALFNLVCNLQVIHFENYGKLLEMDLDVSAYIEEHTRLTHHLSKISHRFRIFLLLEFVAVTTDQFVALIQTTGNRGIINFVNGGDFAVSSIVEVVGIVNCLHSAAKISHRAQALASVTSRWHALVTCNSNDTLQSGISNNGEATFSPGSIAINYSESDLETADFVPVPTNTQMPSSTSLFHKRQAFVTYVQSNLGGATIFGWTIDRVLINTIFFVEMSLVLFVLGMTITFSTK